MASADGGFAFVAEVSGTGVILGVDGGAGFVFAGLAAGLEDPAPCGAVVPESAGGVVADVFGDA